MLTSFYAQMQPKKNAYGSSFLAAERAQKLEIYKQGNHPLIELSQKELRSLDKKLRAELLKLGTEV